MKLQNKTIIYFPVLFILTSCEPFPAIYSASPLNSQHQFRFDWCDFTYNQQPIHLGEHIDKFIALAGDNYRVLKNETTWKERNKYIWDEIGAVITTENHLVANIKIIYSNEDSAGGLSDERQLANARTKSLKNTIKNLIFSKPKNVFQGSISMDGALVDHHFPGIASINYARFRWAQENHKTFPYEKYDRTLGKGEGTRVRFDKDGNITFSKQIHYFGNQPFPQLYVFNRLCGEKRVQFNIQILSDEPTKIYRAGISLMNLDKLQEKKKNAVPSTNNNGKNTKKSQRHNLNI